MATYWPSSSFCVFMDRDGVVVRKVGKLVRQSQIVQCYAGLPVRCESSAACM